MKTVSSKNIISKVFRDFGNENTSFVHDAIEWIGETLERIGTTVMYTNSVCTLEVKCHKACIPPNSESIVAISYMGKRLRRGSNQRSVGFVTEKIEPHTEWVQQPLLSGNNQALANMNNTLFPFVFHTSHYYDLNPGYIITSFEEGKIDVYHKAFPIDDNGFPMVWDNVYVREACMWGIISKMLMSGQQHPVINYDRAVSEHERFIMLSRTADFPNIDDMERFRNMWVRMVPDVDAYQSFFEQSELRNDIWM